MSGTFFILLSVVLWIGRLRLEFTAEANHRRVLNSTLGSPEKVPDTVVSPLCSAFLVPIGKFMVPRLSTRREITRITESLPDMLVNVGQFINNREVKMASSLQNACELIVSEQWYSYLASCMNGTGTDLQRNGYRFFSDKIAVMNQLFSPLIGEWMKNMLIPFEDSIISKDNSNILQLHDCVRGAIGTLLYCRLGEIENRKYIRCNYSLKVYDWILKGHLSCGWVGSITAPNMTDEERSAGLLVVY